MTEEPLEPPAAEGEPPTSEPPAEADADTGANAAAHTAVGALQTRVAELEDLLLRALADADNMRKRVAREIEQAREDERARVAELWLPVVDNLDRALEHADADPASIVAGIQAVRDQALAILDRLGFPRRADQGVLFDPNRHEAVATIPAGETTPGTVVETVRPGYGTDARMLRPAAVVVARTHGDHDRA